MKLPLVQCKAFVSLTYLVTYQTKCSLSAILYGCQGLNKPSVLLPWQRIQKQKHCQAFGQSQYITGRRYLAQWVTSSTGLSHL